MTFKCRHEVSAITALVFFDLDTKVGAIFRYAVETMEQHVLVVFFDDSFWSDA